MTYKAAYLKQTPGFTVNVLVDKDTGEIKKDESGNVIYERRPNRALKRKIYSGVKRDQKKGNN